MPKHRGANYRKRKLQKKRQLVDSFKKTFVNICKASVVVIILFIVAMIIYSGYKKVSKKIEKSNLFNINQVIVKGNISLPADKIVEMCGIKKNEKLYRVKAEEVVNKICQNIWIESAKCLKKWYGAVVLEVKERKPIALVNRGEIELIDRNGVLMPFKRDEKINLPLIYVPDKTYEKNGIKYLDSIYVKYINFIVDKLAISDINLLEKVSQVEVNNGDSFICKISESPVFVKMDYNLTEKQLKNLYYLLNLLTGNSDTVKTIVDIRYNNIAYVKNVLINQRDL